MKLNHTLNKILITVLLFILFFFTSCTTIHFKAIPPPPQSTKLRVAILPVTGDMGKNPFIPDSEWVPLMFKLVGEHLRDTGIYEVVPQEEVNAVVTAQELAGAEGYWWLRNDCALLKRYGKAVHADYGMLITRRAQIPGSRLSGYEYHVEFINIEKGTRYSASDYVAITGNFERTRDIVIKMWPNLYRKIFHDVKRDLLETAIRKGRLMPVEEMKKQIKPDTDLALAPPVISTKEKPSPAVQKPIIPSPPASKMQEKAKVLSLQPELSAVDKRKGLEKKLEDGLQNKMPSTDKMRIAVYDFDAGESLNVIALILTDALREEILRLGRFSLVNRENMMQVLQELKLEHSGLVDEKQIENLGKWFAVNETVTGRITLLGNSYILQAKRTNIKTMETLGVSTLKCSRGQEEELLSGISVFAKKLIGLY